MLISSEPKRAPRGVFGHPNFPYLFDDEPDEVARFRKPDRIIDLDLWEEKACRAASPKRGFLVQRRG